MKRTGKLFAGLLALSILAGCTASTKSSKTAASMGTLEPIHTEIIRDNISYRLTHAQETTASDYKANVGNTLIICDFRVENLSDHSIDFDPALDLAMIDHGENSTHTSLDVSPTKSELESTTIASGESASGKVVFEVPEEGELVLQVVGTDDGIDGPAMWIVRKDWDIDY